MSTAASGRRVSVVIPAYRDAGRAIELAGVLQAQRLPPDVAMDVVVVDDGSGDGSFARMAAGIGARATVIGLPANGGRAVARNAGAAAARGDLLFFMDCDCLPADDALIAGHLEAWAAGVVATIGPVAGTGEGFWDRYQAAASRRRARQHAAGLECSGSSQNMMVSRAAFEACGGFDPDYRTYGFEDRDLQLRLARLGRIAWAPAAGVRHMDALALPTVCRKMAEAGGDAAVLFSDRHPRAYEALGYAALDARRHRWLVLPARMAGPLLAPLARAGDRLLRIQRMPYWLGAVLVKGLTALGYLYGTARSRLS